MMETRNHSNTNQLQEDFDDFFERSLCGFIIADPRGVVLRANATMGNWLHCSTGELEGKKFADLLSIGGKVYYETHLSPLLRMQGFFDEVVLELSGPGAARLRVMVNAFERKDEHSEPLFIRYTILKASDRLQYEQNLQQAKAVAENELLSQKEIVALREQFIAVLGHDLRNPLCAVSMAAELLENAVSGEDRAILQTLKRSSSRMVELVNNIMDFTRTRLGEEMLLNRRKVLMQPILRDVVEEIILVHPGRPVNAMFSLADPVDCDPDRIAQLCSNLLANAMTHGAAGTPVNIMVRGSDGNLEMSITNQGNPIGEHLRSQLFDPLTRGEKQPNLNGLGLGLYISSAIARAHNASLTYVSAGNETCFTFSIRS
ncbi:MAG: hypothetical protein JWQ27_3324 [Ferruginibacter sp.]|nr:hypothetical protein [Ferruginibacter sp.]